MKRTLLAFFISFLAIAAFSQGSIDGDEVNVAPPNTYTQTGISIYPNPATSFISIDEDENVKTLTIYNLVGRELKSFYNVKKDERYDINDLPNGMYLVQIINHSNKIISTQRISKR